MPPIITAGPIEPVTDHFRAVTLEERFYKRINELLSQQILSPVELTDQEAYDAALVHPGSVATGFAPRSEFRVINRGSGYDANEEVYFACTVHAFDRETEETVLNHDLKIPLGHLPEGFDSLPQAEKDAAVIAWGQNVARTVNFYDY